MKFILVVILAGHAQYAIGPFATHLDCTKHPIQAEAERVCIPLARGK
jgi:hypothetical protein